MLALWILLIILGLLGLAVARPIIRELRALARDFHWFGF